jgi:hypothetical protein
MEGSFVVGSVLEFGTNQFVVCVDRGGGVIVGSVLGFGTNRFVI